MYSHEPKDYFCPMCMIVAGKERDGFTRQADVFYRDEGITAFVSLVRWPDNGGNSVIVPNKHFENIYDMPDDLLSRITVFSKRIAMAYKKMLRCEGVSVRQHNEPAGDQDVWHYHLHVIPRWEEDRLYQRHEEKMVADETERAQNARKLREYLNKRVEG